MTLGHKLVRTPAPTVSSELPHDPLPPAVHSLLPPTPRIRLSVFSDTCALFHFPYSIYPASFPQFAHSCAKNRGYTFTLSKNEGFTLSLNEGFTLSLNEGFTLSLNEGFTLSLNEGFTLSLNEGPIRRSFSGGGPSPLFPLHTNTSLVCLLFPLLTQKQGGVPPPKNVGAPTFSIFPLIFRTFLVLSAVRRVARHVPADGGRYTSSERDGQAHPLQRQREKQRAARATLLSRFLTRHFCTPSSVTCRLLTLCGTQELPSTLFCYPMERSATRLIPPRTRRKFNRKVFLP